MMHLSTAKLQTVFKPTNKKPKKNGRIENYLQKEVVYVPAKLQILKANHNQGLAQFQMRLVVYDPAKLAILKAFHNNYYNKKGLHCCNPGSSKGNCFPYEPLQRYK